MKKRNILFASITVKVETSMLLYPFV